MNLEVVYFPEDDIFWSLQEQGYPLETARSINERLWYFFAKAKEKYTYICYPIVHATNCQA